MESKYCSIILETVYNNNLNIFNYLKVRLHTLFCESCAQRIKLYQSARTIMRNDFFPVPQNMENIIMNKIDMEEKKYSESGAISTRSWVIAGLIIFISFATAFFGIEFKNIANETGASFMLPFGIIFGIVLTTYCAVFIGSHLKELTDRFGL